MKENHKKIIQTWFKEVILPFYKQSNGAFPLLITEQATYLTQNENKRPDILNLPLAFEIEAWDLAQIFDYRSKEHPCIHTKMIQKLLRVALMTTWVKWEIKMENYF